MSSENNNGAPQPLLSDGAVEALLEEIDGKLHAVCSVFPSMPPAQFVQVLAYMLTAIFYTDPHLYDHFIALLAAFEPRYSDTVDDFKVLFPAAWRSRREDEVVVVRPLCAKAALTETTN